MKAIIRVGSHQYNVEQGKTVLIDKLDGRVGSEVRFNNLIFVSNGKEAKYGPTLKGAVYGKILSQLRGEKLAVFKKGRRKGFHKKIGHRQPYTKIEIIRIEV